MNRFRPCTALSWEAGFRLLCQLVWLLLLLLRFIWWVKELNEKNRRKQKNQNFKKWLFWWPNFLSVSQKKRRTQDWINYESLMLTRRVTPQFGERISENSLSVPWFLRMSSQRWNLLSDVTLPSFFFSAGQMPEQRENNT